MGPHSGGILTAGKVGGRPVDVMKGIAGLASDSREIKPGYLFAALPGSRADGAAFVADAVRRGAVAVLGAPQIRGEAERLGVRFIADENPRARLARMAADFFRVQPKTVAAVTGTNGKTSVTVFLRQIWERVGLPAASMGTIGVIAGREIRPLGHTTPDPIEMHRLLAQLKKGGIDHLALEASSHGLDQYRLDGVDIAAAAFTNITRDHLDYHADFARYLAAKLRLFSEVAREEGSAVINADAPYAEEFIAAARARKLRVATVGAKGKTLRLAGRAIREQGQALDLEHDGRGFRVELPLVGDFQAANALLAAALAICLGEPPDNVFTALAGLKGAPGRLEKVAYAASGAPIYVDYAHTPDALENVLSALRPHVARRLSVVFGCGGDRDKGKRALMGRIAAELADRAIVTDDNPRTEDAAQIRRQILEGCPNAREIGDRALAIREAVEELGPGDCLVIAGKGHETGQVVGKDVKAFSDREEAVKVARELGGAEAQS